MYTLNYIYYTEYTQLHRILHSQKCILAVYMYTLYIYKIYRQQFNASKEQPTTYLINKILTFVWKGLPLKMYTTCRL